MKRKALNAITSVMLQMATVVCGLVLPRMILAHYGSDVNGLVQSISQFMGYIVLAELGVGAVLQSALYGPLARRDWGQVSRVMKSGRRFYRGVAVALAAYAGALMLFYPKLKQVSGKFPAPFVAGLIAIMTVAPLAGYWIDAGSQLLMIADRRGYVVYLTTLAATLLNTAACALAMHLGGTIQQVRLVMAAFGIATALLYWLEAKRRYPLNYRVALRGEPIAQKWNGIGQHVAFVVLENTDVAVLTLFSTLANVSVYTVHHLVVYGVKKLFTSVTHSMQAELGALWVAGDRAALNRFFSRFESATHYAATLLFSCTGVLIVPFVTVFTRNVNDAEYIQPLFAALMVLAHGMNCLRDPYDKLVLAAGHFKQTQGSYIFAAALNLGVSIIAVRSLGLVGVAIGTLAAMAFQTLWLALYDARALLKRPASLLFKRLAVDAATAAAIVLAGRLVPFLGAGYLGWALRAALVALIGAAITAAAALLFDRGDALALLGWLRRRTLR